MLEHPATEGHLDALRERGVAIVDRLEISRRARIRRRAVGRRRRPRRCDRAGLDAGRVSLAGERVLITAGPTREAIDPVRFLSNASTGTTGIEIAREALARGAIVDLILGPTAPFRRRAPTSCGSRRRAKCWPRRSRRRTLHRSPSPPPRSPTGVRRAPTPQKVKKTDEPQTIALERNPDILAALGERKNGTFLVGFAAETTRYRDGGAGEAARETSRCDCGQRRERRRGVWNGRKLARCSLWESRPQRTRPWPERELEARFGMRSGVADEPG